MIRPPAFMRLAASWTSTSSARALVASTQSHCFGESSSPLRRTPEAALLTRTSRRPARRWTSVISLRISSGSFKSAWSSCTVPPRRSTSCAVFSAASRFTKKFTKTWARASAKRSAIARPMPRPPPVTSTWRGVGSLMGAAGRRRVAAARRRREGRRLELTLEGAEPIRLPPGAGAGRRPLEPELERRRRDADAVDGRGGVERPDTLARPPLATDAQLVAGADRPRERDAREALEPADLDEVMAHGDQELARLRESLHDERSRKHRVARKVIGEHVLGGADVLQRVDAPQGLGGDDTVDEDEAHGSRRRPPDGRPRDAPSGSRSETSGARELRHDVLADSAHGEAVHHGVHRARRVETPVEITGEALDGEAGEIERRRGQIVEHALDQLAHERALVAVGAGHTVLGRHVREDGGGGRRRDRPQLLGRHLDAVSCLDDLGQHGQVAPLDPAVLDEPHRQVDPEDLLALEAHVEEVDRFGAEVPHQRGAVGDLSLVDAEGLDDNLADAHVHLGAGPDLQGVRLHAFASSSHSLQPIPPSTAMTWPVM